MKVFRDIRGQWYATETHPLTADSKYILEISTRRISSGSFRTSASFHAAAGNGFYVHEWNHHYRNDIGLDYFRATRAAVEKFHQECIRGYGGVDILIAEARAKHHALLAQHEAA